MLLMDLCVHCNKEPKTKRGVTGKCFNCSRSHPMGEKQRLSISMHNSGSGNGMWKNSPVLISLHEWVRKRMPLPKQCVNCGSTKNIDLANKGTYDRQLVNWNWLCRKCHMTQDGRLGRLTGKST